MKLYRLYYFLGFLLLAGTRVVCAKAPHLETKLSVDSATLSLNIPHHLQLTSGETFTARIHINVHEGWWIFSSSTDPEGGILPLAITIPPELSKYFKLIRFREIGPIQTRYDSNFLAVNKMHLKPFDVMATIKVLCRTNHLIPFRLWLRYMTCDSMNCLPPRWFEVPMTMLGQQTVNVRISEVVEQNKRRLPFAKYKDRA